MLCELTISNFAIIDKLHIEFASGFNVLTGETGAGKSILVDAINLLIGGKASPEMIRTGEEEATVEGFFEFKEASNLRFLEKWPVDSSGELAIKRLIHRSGKSRAFLNGQAITLHMLADLGEELIHIYGQHEHQYFLNPEKHLEILDRSAGLLPLLQEYQQVYQEWKKKSTELAELENKEKQRTERLELLNFQWQEISRANLQPPRPGQLNEEEELLQEKVRLLHAEKLYTLAQQGTDLLYGEKGSAVERLKVTLQRLKEGMKIDATLSPLASALENALFQIEDIASTLRGYAEKIVFDPKLLEEISSRLDEIQRLKKKYGPTFADVLQYKERIASERQQLASLEVQIDDLRKNTRELAERTYQKAKELSTRRKKAAQELSAKVEEELATLGMKKVRFDIEVEEDEQGRCTEWGINRVQFLLSPNPGEELRPLMKIASGGELSRIMLAMKRILAEDLGVETLIFDEVDAGIGGGMAEVVGRKLKEISRKHQVFCITHLPQIASLGDAHYKVSKIIRGGRTIVECQRLKEKEREEEIARMLGGMKITEKTLAHAREMLKNAEKKR